MSAKDRLSRDQRRKAQLAALARRAKRRPIATPYSGRKYQQDKWVPQTYATERAVYEVILITERQLTNDQVREAFGRLIEHLRGSLPAPVAADEPETLFQLGREVDYLVWNIRRHWRTLFEEQGPVAREDLIGILRTLLYSIQTHALHTGRARGYVSFLYHFMQQRW
jgi:hypothetical protein